MLVNQSLAGRTRKRIIAEMGAFTEEQALVAQANESFYRAVESFDVPTVAAAWLQSDVVKCIHPNWEPLTGWDQVMESWRLIFRNTRRMRFELSDVLVDVRGGFGWVQCIEHIFDGPISLGDAVATNLFQQNADGRWLMVLHHASPFVRRMI
jgi:ketosteroid isomerase-like protein